MINITILAMATFLGLPSAVPSATSQFIVPDSDVAPVLLTDTLVTRYLAVRSELGQFFLAHPDMFKTTPLRTYQVALQDANGQVQETRRVVIPDLETLVQKAPAVDSIFLRHHLTVDDYVPITITIQRAMFATVMHYKHGGIPKDENSITARNYFLVLNFYEWFEGSSLALAEP